MTTESKLTAAGLGAIYGILDNLGPAPHHARMLADAEPYQIELNHERANAMRDKAAAAFVAAGDKAYADYRKACEDATDVLMATLQAAYAIEKGE